MTDNSEKNIEKKTSYDLHYNNDDIDNNNHNIDNDRINNKIQIINKQLNKILQNQQYIINLLNKNNLI